MPRKIKKFIFPGMALVISIYFSMVFAIGAVIGYITTEIFCKKLLKTGKVKSLVFETEKWHIHVHHWIFGGLAILGVYVFGFMASMPVIFLGVLGGLMFHDIHTDKKQHQEDIAWYNVIYRK